MKDEKEKQDAKIRKAINDHHFWLSQWRKENGAWSVEMVSPRGKRMSHLGYCQEVTRHMAKTVLKIRKAINVEGSGK